jgi:hypothetical protein
MFAILLVLAIYWWLTFDSDKPIPPAGNDDMGW